jgi:hypothetical protein
MESVHHKPIKRFYLEGTIHDDSAIPRLRQEYYRLLVTEMRLSGYVPRLDINTDFTLQYNQQHNHFEFKISSYGVYVGKRQSEWISGIDETTVIYTEKSKSNESLQAQASRLNPK